MKKLPVYLLLALFSILSTAVTAFCQTQARRETRFKVDKSDGFSPTKTADNLNTFDENHLYLSSLLLMQKHEFGKARVTLEKLLVSVRSVYLKQKSDFNRIRILQVLTKLTLACFGTEKFDESNKHFEEGLSLWSELSEENQASHPIIIRNFAEFCFWKRDYTRAELLAKKLLSAQERKAKLADLIDTLDLLESIYYCSHRNDLAKQMATKSLKIQEGLFGKNSPELVEILSTLECLYYGHKEKAEYSRRRENLLKVGIERDCLPCLLIDAKASEHLPRKAISKYQHVLQIQRKSVPPDKVELARTLEELGICYCKLSNWKRAEAAFQESASLLGSQYDPNDPGVLEQLVFLSRVKFALSQQKECTELLRRVFEAQKAGGAEFRGHIGNRIAVYADFYGAKYSDKNEPENFLKLAISLQQEILGSSHKDLIDTYEELSHIYVEGNNLKEGNTYLEKALQVADVVRTVHKGSIYCGYGMALRRAGHAQLAKKFFSKANACWSQERKQSKAPVLLR